MTTTRHYARILSGCAAAIFGSVLTASTCGAQGPMSAASSAAPAAAAGGSKRVEDDENTPAEPLAHETIREDLSGSPSPGTRGSIPVDPRAALPAASQALSPTLRAQRTLQETLAPELRCGPGAERFQKRYLAALKERSNVAMQRLEEDAKTYESVCLNGPPTPGAWILESPTVRNRVALLVHESDAREVFCGAFVLRPNLAVTAKHCFFEPEGSPTHSRANALAKRAIQLVTIGAEPQMSVVASIAKVGPATPGARNIEARGDYLFLALKGAITDLGPLPKPVPSPIKEIPAAYLAGFFGLSGFDMARPIPELTNAVRWSKALCGVTQVTRKGCLFHTCQSIRGFSGSPIFAEDPAGGDLQLAGLVTGAADGSDTCLAQISAGTNLGVAANNVLDAAP